MKRHTLTFDLFPKVNISNMFRSLFTDTDRSVSSYVNPPAKNRKSVACYSLKTELYFGLSKPDGKLISENEWQRFTDKYISPLFNKGLTVFDAAGQWQLLKTGEIIKEKTKVLILLHNDDEVSSKNINHIRVNYMKIFNQESVLRITSSARISV